MERSLKNMPEKVLLMLITSLMTSQHDVKFGLLYSCLYEIVTFSAIQVVVFNQSSLNFTHICSLAQHRRALILGQRSMNYVTMSKSRSNFKIVITLLIFKLECRPKAQNVGHWVRYLTSMHNFR